MVSLFQGGLLTVCVWLTRGAELTYPSELSASAGTHTLTFTSDVDFGAYGFKTRGINGGVPGPTLRMKPGETLSLTLKNDMMASNNVDCSTTGSEYCEASITNLHTHGLHVSSKGIVDGLAAESDNIFATTAPGGGSTPYAFTIPANHMGGTHWYHPHHHHATALQAGGGLAGVLIVEDPTDYLPTEYSSMPEKIMFVSGHNLQTLQTIATSSQSNLWTTAVADAGTAGLDTLAFMVNGQTGPTLTMNSHTWYRWRMVYAAVEAALVISVSGDATCTMNLIAKDGVYLHSFPRAITKIYLYPGSRADVAVACTCTTYPCTGILGSSTTRRLQKAGGGGAGPGTAAADTANVNLMTISILETSGGVTSTLPTTIVGRPCYLQDLQSLTVPAANTGTINLQGAGRVVQWNGAGTSMTYANTHADGKTAADWPPLTTLQAGGIYEIGIEGANAHPFHLHINPYQIAAMPAASYGGGYFAIGDWHDTLMISEMAAGPGLTVRLLTNGFTGKMVVHCHILEHEDEGMMAYIEVGGTEGALYSGASTCYSAAFVSGGTVTSAPSATTGTTGAAASAATTLQAYVAVGLILIAIGSSGL